MSASAGPETTVPTAPPAPEPPAEPAVVEVAFKGNRREFFLWSGREVPKVGTPVIVEADRGEDYGVVHSPGELARRDSPMRSTGRCTPTRRSGIRRWRRCCARWTASPGRARS